jgi:hypothetical protein
MKFLTFNTVTMNILQAILFVCRWFCLDVDKPEDSQTVVTPVPYMDIQAVKEKPGIWRLGKNNLDRFRLCFIPGFTACDHPHFCSSGTDVSSAVSGLLLVAWRRLDDRQL